MPTISNFPACSTVNCSGAPWPTPVFSTVDTSKAAALPGVRCVITGADLPKVTTGNWRLFPKTQDEYALAIDKVRYIGDEVAAVAATDPDIAEAAIELIEVEYEELPGVYDIEKRPERRRAAASRRIQDQHQHRPQDRIRRSG